MSAPSRLVAGAGAVSVAGVAWMMMPGPSLNQQRILRAQSGSALPSAFGLEPVTEPAKSFAKLASIHSVKLASIEAEPADRLKRRPSWSTKFEGPTTQFDATRAQKHIENGAEDRLQRLFVPVPRP